MEQTDA